MKVVVMFSGGKDSTYAVEYCKARGWDIAYLLSVKPTRTDCYLFHYATVEHTPMQAEAMGLKHVLVSCDVADPVKEGEIVRDIIIKNEKVDAVVLGGTGLQETQLRTIQKLLLPFGIEVFAAHAGQDHEEAFRDMIARGYEIMITQVASDGLLPWLGRKVTTDNFDQLRKDSVKYGFHIGFEGGFADTFVLSAPVFRGNRIGIDDYEKIVEDLYCGHVMFKNTRMVQLQAPYTSEL